MDRHQADALVSRLGDGLGIAELGLDDGGTCTLVIDNGAIIVSLGHNAAAGALDLMTCLDQIDPTPANLSRALQANFSWRGTGGATFAMEPGAGSFVLQRRLDGAEATQDGLKAALEALVAAAEAWTKRLSEQQTGEDAAERAAPPPLGSMRP
jgi:hypothetical protein